MDTVTMKLQYISSSFKRNRNDICFSVINRFSTNAPVIDAEMLLQTDILGSKYDAIHIVKDHEVFTPPDTHDATQDVTGSVLTEKISAIHLIPMSYDEVIAAIEAYIAEYPEDCTKIGLGKLFYNALDQVGANVEKGRFYYLNTGNFPPDSHLFEWYDYFIIIIAILETGNVVRLTFGSD